MEKISLKLFEFLSLEVEINGLVNQQTGETVSKGLLGEKLNMVTKYWITDLNKRLTSEKESINKLRDELIMKFGTQDEQNGYQLIPSFRKEDGVDEEGNPKFINEPNPQFFEFQKEYNDLLNQERELEYKPFSIADFKHVETDGNYSTFFQLIKIED